MTSTDTTPTSCTQEDIAALARKFWEEEGRPEGKAEEHWQRAEQTLRQPQSESPAVAAPSS